MSGPKVRSQNCSRADARTRLAQAKKFLEVAELAGEEGVPESGSVAAATAVLAGIAASDAACCAALGRRARGPDHHEAAGLLETIEPGGKAAATALRRLLDLKDTAQYGLTNLSKPKRTTALRQAATLIDFADTVLRR